MHSTGLAFKTSTRQIGDTHELEEDLCDSFLSITSLVPRHALVASSCGGGSSFLVCRHAHPFLTFRPRSAPSVLTSATAGSAALSTVSPLIMDALSRKIPTNRSFKKAWFPMKRQCYVFSDDFARATPTQLSATAVLRLCSASPIFSSYCSWRE